MRRLFFLFSILFFQQSGLFAQPASTVEFGKNRVQYHNRFKDWLEYESDNFVGYWYGDARNVAQFSIQMAEYDFNNIQSILEHRMSDKMEIIVFTDLTDLKQSNMGYEENLTLATGQTKIAGSKIFVYFDGNHQHLRRQIREGIAEVFLNSILFGSNLQEMVQNAVMLNMPLWFKQGLICYCGSSWGVEEDNELKDWILNEKNSGFYELAQQNPRLAGHSFWHYIALNYGASTIPNMLYLARINKSVGSGFLYVIGTSYESLLDSWRLFYRELYEKEGVAFKSLNESGEIKFKNKRKLPVFQPKISPDGKNFIYATNEDGQLRVYLQSLQDKKSRQLIFKTGYRNKIQETDYTYPLLAWKPNSSELAIVYEKRDVIKYSEYDTKKKKRTEKPFGPDFQRVYSFDFIDNSTAVISAAIRGQSDLFLYKTKNNQSERITNDFYDDLDAAFVQIGNKKGIVFASNRKDSLIHELKLDSLLPIDKLDIFYYNLDERPNTFLRLTKTPLYDERLPLGIDTTWLTWITEKSGIQNREKAYLQDVITGYKKGMKKKDGMFFEIPLDSVLSVQDSLLVDSFFLKPILEKQAFVYDCSNFERNLERHHISANGKMLDLFTKEGRPRLLISQFDTTQTEKPTMTNYALSIRQTPPVSKPLIPAPKEEPTPPKQEQEQEPTPTRQDTIPPKPIDNKAKVNIDDYQFQSEFDEQEKIPVVKVEEQSGKVEVQTTPDKPKPQSVEDLLVDLLKKNENPPPSVYTFKTAKIIPYQIKFRTDNLTAKLDNSPLFGGLDSYTGFPQGLVFQPLGILLKANFKDLLEDYEIEGGARFPTSFNGSEFFLLYKDRKKKLDKTYAVYRRSFSYSGEDVVFVPQRHRVVTNLLYAKWSYPLDVFRSIRFASTLRFDKTTQLSTDNPSLIKPTAYEQRIGGRLEYIFDNTLDIALNIKNGTRYKFYAEMTKRFDLSFGNNVNLNFKNGFMNVVGLDFRHYQRLDRYSIFAVRAAAATSFGSEKVLYFLGGVDNALFAGFNQDIPFTAGGSYAYQTLANNIRGFRTNIRNGSSYALINSELRFPVLRYLFPRSTSSFNKNFQLVGFFDVGTAWEGASPYSRENPLNTVIIRAPSSGITIKVNYFRDPIVGGCGIGMRTMFLGYHARVDYAWGIETNALQKPMWHFSIGTDF